MILLFSLFSSVAFGQSTDCRPPEFVLNEVSEHVENFAGASAIEAFGQAQASFACSPAADPAVLGTLWLAQGLAWVYAANLEEAEHSFAAARRLDAAWPAEYGEAPELFADAGQAQSGVGQLRSVQRNDGAWVAVDGKVVSLPLELPAGVHLVQAGWDGGPAGFAKFANVPADSEVLLHIKLSDPEPTRDASVAVGAVGSCPLRSTTGEFEATLSQAESAFADLDVDGFMGAMDEITMALPCISGPLSPKTAAQVHLVMGIRAYTAGDEAHAVEALTAARHADDQLAIPDTLVPAGHPIHLMFERVDLSARVKTQSVPTAAAGTVHLDGEPSASRPRTMATVVQVIGGDGASIAGGYVYSDQELPWYPAGKKGKQAREVSEPMLEDVKPTLEVAVLTSEVAEPTIDVIEPNLEVAAPGTEVSNVPAVVEAPEVAEEVGLSEPDSEEAGTPEPVELPSETREPSAMSLPVVGIAGAAVTVAGAAALGLASSAKSRGLSATSYDILLAEQQASRTFGYPGYALVGVGLTALAIEVAF